MLRKNGIKIPGAKVQRGDFGCQGHSQSRVFFSIHIQVSRGKQSLHVYMVYHCEESQISLAQLHKRARELERCFFLKEHLSALYKGDPQLTIHGQDFEGSMPSSTSTRG